MGAAGQVLRVSLPCPSSTTAIVVRDKGPKHTSGVTDSQSNTYTRPTLQASYPNIYYVNNPSVNPGMTVSLKMNTSGGYSCAELGLPGNTAGIDTGATTSNGATLNGAAKARRITPARLPLPRPDALATHTALAISPASRHRLAAI